jgi:hypothetical protein
MYSWLFFYRDTYEFHLAAVKFYEQILKDDLNALKADPDINQILDDEVLKSLPLHKEIQRVSRIREWMEGKLSGSGASAIDFEVSVSHGTVRFLKGTMLLYLKQLKQRRNLISERPNISRHALDALDTRISELEEKTQIGVFAIATPEPLLVNEVPQEKISESLQPPTEGLSGVLRPRPVILGSIEILDSEIRSRCLDLFEAFRTEGTTDRLDTVLTEGTRILENRIRAIAKLPADCVGLDLAKTAFGGTTPALRVSDIAAEQEAIHLLYRGVFGFIRNQVHHKLVGELRPERVLQILGLIDYLIFVAEGARRVSGESTE